MKTSEVNILVVDDNIRNLYLVKELLLDKEYVIHAISSPNDAFAILDKHDIDLLILDIQMPEIDGFQLAQKIYGDEKNKDIPLIFLTAKYQDSDSVLKGLNIGAIDYMFKPIDSKIFIKKIENLLALSSDNKMLKAQQETYKYFLKKVKLY